MKEQAISSGSSHTISPRPGMHVHIADFKPNETIEQRVEVKGSWLRFTFFLLGSGYWEWRSAKGYQKPNEAAHIDQRSFISYCPEGEAKICFPARRRHFHLSVRVRPSLVADYVDGCWELVPPEFRDICEGYSSRDFHHLGPLSPIMDVAIQHLLDCPYAGSMKKLYCESKAIELIAHKMAQIASPEGATPPSSHKLRHDDMERIRHARDILGQDLENPPGLFELARAVGTTHTKLNRGFREVFGSTVFGYLRTMRLEMARRLLEEEGLNVTEAALNVGYSSISSFSRAFSEHFGQNPKQFQRKSR
jgi:AraC family transcriptional activator of pyochelin receptor